jgi:hypothetical protein
MLDGLQSIDQLYPKFVAAVGMTEHKRYIGKKKSELANFLEKVEKTPISQRKEGTGRLLFAMDATASREKTWDHACHIQGEMFRATSRIGGLNIQLCYYRGFNQFNSSPWTGSETELVHEMSKVRCLGGHTQIEKILNHALKEHRNRRINALVFVGDAIEEDSDKLCFIAGKLGVLNIPVFVFQEGINPLAMTTFRQIAELSGGAYAPFNSNSAEELKNLLAAVAVYAAGGREALEKFEKENLSGKMLTVQIGK